MKKYEEQALAATRAAVKRQLRKAGVEIPEGVKYDLRALLELRDRMLGTAVTEEEVRKERRKTEELLRRIVKHFMDQGNYRAAVELCISTRSWMLGEIEDEEV